MKNVRIWSFSGPYFPTFGLNTSMNTPKTLNKSIFYAALAIFAKHFPMNVWQGLKCASININTRTYLPSQVEIWQDKTTKLRSKNVVYFLVFSSNFFGKKLIPKQINTCSKWAVRTLEKVWNMLNGKNKNTRATLINSFWCIVCF